MMKYYVKIQSMLQREEGQGMVEYAMIIGLVAIGVLALLGTMGDSIGELFGRIDSEIQGALDNTGGGAGGN